MAEPELAQTGDEVVAEVAHFLGWGRLAYASLSAAQQAHWTAINKAAIRLAFLNPPPIGNVQHKWSFLITQASLNLYATGTAVGDPDGGTTITATDSVFTAAMVGGTIAFTTSENTYTISGYTSGTEITVSETIAGETSGDTFTVTGYYEFNLPAGFGQITGPITYSDVTYTPPLTCSGDGAVRLRHQQSTTYGRPTDFGVLWKSRTAASTAQVCALRVWPRPDSLYTLIVPYSLAPDAVDLTEYPPAGPWYAALYRAACLAVAEETFLDMRGLKWQGFMEALDSAIRHDRETTAPENLGQLRPLGRTTRGLPHSRIAHGYIGYVRVGG
jgi:hypothetical protein